MQDSYFTRSVILLCEYDKEGAFGFVLNKYIELDLGEILGDNDNFRNQVCLGGPVQTDNLFYVHSLGKKVKGSIRIREGIYLGGEFEELKGLLTLGKAQPEQVRFFVGYSGWDAGQLDDEMEQKSWYVCEPGSLPLMEGEQNDLWGKALAAMGGEFAALAHIPADPGMN